MAKSPKYQLVNEWYRTPHGQSNWIVYANNTSYALEGRRPMWLTRVKRGLRDIQVGVGLRDPIHVIPPGLLPKGARYFIAGGYAACPELAGDIDVWVPHFEGYYAQYSEHIIDHIRAQGIGVISHDTLQKLDLGDDDISKMDSYGEIKILACPIGTAYPWGLEGRPVQIMLSRAPVEVLLAAFDISTHQIALMDNGLVVKGDQWTPITEVPHAIHVNKKTRERMIKICRRYGFEREAREWEQRLQ